METATDVIYLSYCLGLQNHCRWWLQPWNWKTRVPWKKSYDQPRQHIKKQRHYFANKGPSSQRYLDFSSSHVWMWKLDLKEGWAPKNWCFWTVVLEKTLRVPWTARRSNQSPKADQSWVFIGRTDAEAETPILWPPDGKSWLTGKDRVGGEVGDRGWDGRQHHLVSRAFACRDFYFPFFSHMGAPSQILRVISVHCEDCGSHARLTICLFVSESSGELPWLLVLETGSGVPCSLTKGPFSGRGGQRKPGPTAGPWQCVQRARCGGLYGASPAPADAGSGRALALQG